jgi:hypothetical protein
MDRNITNSQEAFLAACTERGYDAEAIIPDVSKMPGWLAKYTVSSIKRLVIAEAINEGRQRQPGKERVYFPIWDLTDENSPLGFSCANATCWNSHSYVGSRLEFFSGEDSDYFGSNFMDLHADVIPYQV